MVEFDYGRLGACGAETFINAAVEIRRPQLVRLGRRVAIDTGFYCTTAARIGDYCHVGPYVTVIGGANGLLILGHFVTIGAGSRLVCVSDQFRGEGLAGFQRYIPEPLRDAQTREPIVIGDFVNIGSNAVILPGVTLGEGCVIGSGAVVTKSTQPWGVYFGVPARKVKTRPSARMLACAAQLGYRPALEEVRGS